MNDLVDPFPCDEEVRYPALKVALEEIGHPYLLLVKDPGGLFVRENLHEKDPTLELAAQTVCLVSLMITGWMLENDGPERALEFIDRLYRGLVSFVGDEDRYTP